MGATRPRYHPGRYRRPGDREAFEIAIGAILTQNTAWTNVERAIESLNRTGTMRPEALVAVPRRRLETLIRSSGYFRQKAERLKTFVAHLRRRGGLRRWLSGPLPALRDELLSLSGVGPETADSILLYAGARPVFVVDAYTLRIGERLGWFRAATYESAQAMFVESLPRSVKVYQEAHALIVALGKLYCRKEPLCGHCPLAGDCGYARTNRL